MKQILIFLKPNHGVFAGKSDMLEQILIPLTHHCGAVWKTGGIFVRVSFHAHIWLVIDFRVVSPLV